jgi:preprotein translocase subunit YajC
MYFLVIRPEQQRRKAHTQMVDNVRRGDVVVTAGGIVGKVVKVLEGNEVMVEIAEEVRVKVVKQTLLDVRTKTEAVGDASKADDKK